MILDLCMMFRSVQLIVASTAYKNDTKGR